MCVQLLHNTSSGFGRRQQQPDDFRWCANLIPPRLLNPLTYCRDDQISRLKSMSTIIRPTHTDTRLMRKANITQADGEFSAALHLAAAERDTRDGFSVMEESLSPQFTDSAGALEIKRQHGRRKIHLLFIFAALLLRVCARSSQGKKPFMLPDRAPVLH